LVDVLCTAGCVVALLQLLIGVATCTRREPSVGAMPHFPSATKLVETTRVERRHSILVTLRDDSTGTIVKVEAFPGLEEESADALVEQGIIGFEALHAGALSPYPGDISRRIVADEKIRPRRVETAREGRSMTYYLVLANERFGYGLTTPEAAHYRSLLGWLHCADQDVLFKVRIYVPLATPPDELEALFLSSGCPAS